MLKTHSSSVIVMSYCDIYDVCDDYCDIYDAYDEYYDIYDVCDEYYEKSNHDL
jgi:hypothetical protein